MRWIWSAVIALCIWSCVKDDCADGDKRRNSLFYLISQGKMESYAQEERNSGGSVHWFFCHTTTPNTVPPAGSGMTPIAINNSPIVNGAGAWIKITHDDDVAFADAGRRVYMNRDLYVQIAEWRFVQLVDAVWPLDRVEYKCQTVQEAMSSNDAFMQCNSPEQNSPANQGGDPIPSTGSTSGGDHI